MIDIRGDDSDQKIHFISDYQFYSIAFCVEKFVYNGQHGGASKLPLYFRVPSDLGAGRGGNAQRGSESWNQHQVHRAEKRG